MCRVSSKDNRTNRKQSKQDARNDHTISGSGRTGGRSATNSLAVAWPWGNHNAGGGDGWEAWAAGCCEEGGDVEGSGAGWEDFGAVEGDWTSDAGGCGGWDYEGDVSIFR
jgi:hypothetical protein